MIGFAVAAALAGCLAALYIAAPLAKGAGGVGARLLAFASAIALAVGALAVYAVGGAPNQPGRPYADTAAELRAADPETLTPPQLMERLRDEVRRNPRDADALAHLGRLLAADERHLEAVAAFERSLRVDPRPRVMADLGQVFVNLNEGAVTPEAVRVFEEARALDPELPEPAFFLGVAAYQAGDRAAALKLWSEIVARLPEGDPYRRAIAARAADLLSRPAAGPVDGEAAAPFAEAIEAGEDPEALVAAMLERLETRLEQDPGDVPGWMALARARAMNEEAGAAAMAVAEARRAAGEAAGEQAIVTALARALGVDETDA